ncbi:phasin family protein [Pseudomonadota bacterium]
MTAKSKNPFDFSEYFTQIDPKSVLDQWQKAFGQAQIPQVDTTALFETQSKNLYALISANQAIMAGARNLMQRQGELMQEALNDATKAMQDMGKVTDPGEAAAKQSELVQAALDKALANSREMSELIANNYQEAANAINERFSEALNEIKTAVSKNK